MKRPFLFLFMLYKTHGEYFKGQYIVKSDYLKYMKLSFSFLISLLSVGRRFPHVWKYNKQKLYPIQTILVLEIFSLVLGGDVALWELMSSNIELRLG